MVGTSNKSDPEDLPLGKSPKNGPFWLLTVIKLFDD